MTPSEMITCISLDLLWGLAGSFPNFQSICKTTWATEWWTSIRALFGNKGRIDVIHSFGKVTMYYILKQQFLDKTAHVNIIHDLVSTVAVPFVLQLD